jgi:CRP-like cAMP-binding protein
MSARATPSRSAERLLAHRLSSVVALGENEIDALRSVVGRVRTIRRGEVLMAEGDVPPNLLLVTQGWSLRYKRALDGRRQVTGIVVPGELSDKGPSLPFGADHSIQAVTNVEVAEIQRTSLSKAAMDFPLIGQALLADAMLHTAVLREWFARLSRRADERLAHLFYDTHVRLRALGLIEGNAFEFPLLQQDVADCIGVSVVHLNRVLGTLRTQGLIEWTRGAVRLPDPQRLADLAQYNPGLDKLADALRTDALAGGD